jgi:formylglycine-generating enzyme required for sulfatase activity
VASAFGTEGASWPLADRLRALEALGRLGDPRLDGEPWVDLDGGSFTMGEEGAFQSVRPHVERVAAFRMFSRPITVQDYAPFLGSGGYRAPAFWTAGREEEVMDPVGWAEQRFHPNRPVVGVSWYEAMAFCRWATSSWGLDVDLPTDIEWEFAARGPEGRRYAWGPEEPGEGDQARGNHDWGIGAVGHPTPVGAFPGGSQGRLLDLSGNVWEWCHDPFSKDRRYEKAGAADLRGAPRVMRGGSWNGSASRLRCAVRTGRRPWHRGLRLGFRVVCRVSRKP